MIDGRNKQVMTLKTKKFFEYMPAVFIALLLSIIALEMTGDIKSQCDTGGVLVTTVAAADVKASADDTASTVISLSEGSPLFVTGNAGNGWYRVLYQGKNCFVRADKVAYLDIPGNGSPTGILDSQVKTSVPAKVDAQAATEAVAEASEADKSIEVDIDKTDLIETGGLKIKSDPMDENGLDSYDAYPTPLEINEELLQQIDAELEAAGQEMDRMADELQRSKKEKLNSIIWKIAIAMVILAILIVGFVMTVKNSPTQNDDSGADELTEKDSADVDFEILDLDQATEETDETDNTDTVL